MSVIYASISKKGSKLLNEDSIGIKQNNFESIFILADGLGGHKGGDKASLAAATISQAVFESSEFYGNDLISKCFELSQKGVLSLQKDLGEKNTIKTTMVVLLVENGEALWGHIGDSRLYFFKSGRLYIRTMDHSVPQLLCNAKEINEKQIRHHEDRNKLLKVIGIKWDGPEYDMLNSSYKIKNGDAFLLCSDGFWEWINEKEMRSCLKRARNPEQWLNFMENKVVKNGAGNKMDNYSAIAVMVK